MRTRFVSPILFGIICLSISVAWANNTEEGLVFGVFPHMPLNKLYQIHSPMAADFGKSINQQVTLRSSPSFVEFEKTLYSEEYDIALIQPFDYPEAHDKHHYLPLARRGVSLKTIILVDKKSTFQSISDLKGKRIAAAAPTAAVTTMIKREMKQLGFNPETDFKWAYAGSHFSCMQRVLIQEADSCITAIRALKHWESVKLEEKFRVVHTAKSIPHALFVIHERIPEHHRNQIKQTILNWPKTKEGQAILSRGNVIPFIEALDKEYDVLR